MESENSPQLLQNPGIVDAVNMNPGNRRFIFNGEEFIHVLDVFFRKIIPIVIDQRNLCGLAQFFPDMDKGTGRQTRLR